MGLFAGRKEGLRLNNFPAVWIPIDAISRKNGDWGRDVEGGEIAAIFVVRREGFWWRNLELESFRERRFELQRIPKFEANCVRYKTQCLVEQRTRRYLFINISNF